MSTTSNPSRSWLARHRWHLLLALLWLGSLALAVNLARLPEAAPFTIASPPAPFTPTPHPLRVDVAGAVASPGVYTLPPDSIVRDAVLAAGGATEEADLSLLNQAAPLADGVQVYVPRRGEATRPPVGSVPLATPGAGAKININTATPEELDTLPGIGTVLAQRIIEGRPYETIEDILRVPGIGPAIFERLKERITVR